MKPIVLSPDDARIGKVIDDNFQWPAIDIVEQPFEKKNATLHFLAAPPGEQWFVVLPGRFDDGDLHISVEGAKKPEARFEAPKRDNAPKQGGVSGNTESP